MIHYGRYERDDDDDDQADANEDESSLSRFVRSNDDRFIGHLRFFFSSS